MSVQVTTNAAEIKVPTVFYDQHGRKWHAQEVVLTAKVDSLVTAECKLITFEELQQLDIEDL